MVIATIADNGCNSGRTAVRIVCVVEPACVLVQRHSPRGETMQRPRLARPQSLKLPLRHPLSHIKAVVQNRLCPTPSFSEDIMRSLYEDLGLSRIASE